MKSRLSNAIVGCAIWAALGLALAEAITGGK